MPRRRVLLPLLALGAVALAAVGALVAEQMVRAGVEDTVAERVSQATGADVGDVEVEVHDPSALLSLIRGRFDELSVSASGIPADGGAVAASVVARGVPVDSSRPLDSVRGRLVAPADVVARSVRVPGASGSVTLGDGVAGYEASVTVPVLGFQVGYRATATVEPAGDSVRLTPVSVELTGGGLPGLDVTGLVEAATGGAPLTVCIADRLPPGLSVNDIAITPREATVTFSAADLVLSEDALARTGTCP